MKKILKHSLILLLILGSALFYNTLHATHVAGGEITVENISNNQFLVSLSFYRDCTGIPFNDVTSIINVTSSCIPDFNITLFLTNPGGTEVSQVCPADLVNSACNGGPIQGMEEYVFQGIVNLPINCTDYTFSYQEFARNPSINIIGAGGEWFYVDATLNTTLFPNNSTPFFTSPPIPYVCENQAVNYNYGVVEADGDSLAYSLVAARGLGFTGNPDPVTYNTPTYTASAPFPGITINPSTGELSFTPLGPSGNYIVVVRVDEYNGIGQLISSIHRDIQFVVLPCANQIPTVPGTVSNVSVGGGTVNQTGPLEITAEVGSSFCFDVTFSDVNPADEVFVFSNASSALPGSSVTESGINPKTVTVCWTVPQGTNTNNTVLFQAADSACPISGVNSVAVQIVVPPPPALDLNLRFVNRIRCNGNCEGIIVADVFGGSGNYAYTWQPEFSPGGDQNFQGQGTDSIWNVCGGQQYQLQVTDLNDPDPSTNTVDTVFFFVEPTKMEFQQKTKVNDDCDASACNGSINVNVIFGSGTKTYLWNDGSTAQLRTNLCPGIYDLTVTDDSNCVLTESFHITRPTPFGLTLDSIDSVSCFGGNDGAIFTSLDISCGPSTQRCIPAIIGTIGTAGTFNTTTTYPSVYGNLDAGARHQMLYTKSELDAAGIEDVISSIAFRILSQGNQNVFDGFTIKMGCTNVSDLSGGYVANLDTVFFSKRITTSLGWNTHSLDVSYGWDGSSNIAVEVCFNNSGGLSFGNNVMALTNTPFVSTRWFSANNANVCSSGATSGTTNSRPDIRFGHCTNDFTFDWNPAPAAGQNDSIVTGLTAQQYTVSVTTDEGCVVTDTFLVEEPPQLIGVITETRSIRCNGECNGELHLDIVGGIPFGSGFGYTIAWSDGLPSDTVQTGLCAQTYTVTITDKNNCQEIVSYDLLDPDPVVANTVIVSPISCNGDCDGIARVIPGGGTPPYDITWPSGNKNQIDTALCAGTYDVTILDDSLCQLIIPVVVDEPDLLVGALSGTGIVLCNGDNNVTLTGSAIGGTPPYSFLWLPSGATGPTLPGLGAGLYTLVITDFRGCSDTLDTTITEPPLLEVDIVETGSIGCAGATTGELTANPTGGTPNYNYLWSNGATTQVISNLMAGTYTVTVTDANGCTATDTYILAEPPPIIPSIDTLKAACFGICDGVVSVSMAPSANFAIAWPAGVVVVGNDTATNLCAGATYDVTITDLLSLCDTVYTVGVPANAPFIGSIVEDQQIQCSGDTNGQLTANISGGTPGYGYLWNTGATTPTIGGLGAGTYTVTVTDFIGCDTVMTFDLLEPDPVIGAISGVGAILCNGDSNVTLTGSAIGGTPPYTFLWLPSGATGPTLPGLGAGLYTLVITDSRGCSDTLDTTITEPPLLEVTIVETGSIGCAGATTGELTANPTGGTPNYNYLWSNGATTQVISNLMAGTYTVTVTDANSCAVTDTYVLDDPPDIIPIIDTNKLPCPGTCDGQVAVYMNPSANFLITWPAGVTLVGDTANNLCAGTDYLVTITDTASLCDTVYIINIPENPAFGGGITEDQGILCNGDASGQLTANPSGGSPPYSYLWSTGDITPRITGLNAGTYVVTITDANGCDTIMTQDLLEPDPVLATITGAGTILCNGDNTVTLSASASGGSGGYVFLWLPSGATGPVLPNIGAGTYFLIAYDADSCASDTIDTTITEPALLEVDIVETGSIGCAGATTGELTANPSGGTPTYFYNWSNGPSTQINPNLGVGTYSVTVTDINGCTATDTYILDDPPDIIPAIDTLKASCRGTCDGQVVVSMSPAANFSITWPTGVVVVGNDTAVNLCPGTTYDVTITDVNSLCDTVYTIGVPENDPFAGGIVEDQSIVCNGDLSGQLTANISGGTPGYSYQWNTGATTPTIGGLGAATYTVTVTDFIGCDTVMTYNLTEPTAISGVISVQTPISCNDSCDGSLLLVASGGTPPLVIEWSNGDLGPIADNLCEGTYDVTITDANSCQLVQSFNLTDPDPIMPTIDVTNATCGNQNGSIDLLPVTGGNGGPYDYAWNIVPNPGNVSTVGGLGFGLYSVTITNQGGSCPEEFNIPLSEIGGPDTTLFDLIEPLCFDSCNGLIRATPVGGVGPYTYLWNLNPLDTLDSLSSVCEGQYFVFITDSNNCSRVDTVTLGQPDLIVTTPTLTNPTCFGGNDGSISVITAGGNPFGSGFGYNYTWSNGAGNVNVNPNLSSGTYFVTTEDSTGCQVVNTVDVIDPPEILISLTITDPLCFDDCNGSAFVVAAGGAGGFTYAWSTGETSDTATGLCGDQTYSLTVTDRDNCSKDTTFTITNPTPVVIGNITVVNPTCGDPNGELTATASGGTGPYIFIWFDGSVSDTVNPKLNVAAANFRLVVIDANGCSDTSFVPVSNVGGHTVEIQTTPAGCDSSCIGTATAVVTGGSGNFTYTWSDGINPPFAGGQILTDLCPGDNWFVTVTDVGGVPNCVAVDNATISGSGALLLTFNVVDNIQCGSATICTGSAAVLASGGAEPYTYLWSTGDVAPTITGLCGNSFYTVTVTSFDGCSAVDSVFVDSIPSPTFTVDSVINTSCLNTNDGAIQISVSGGVPPYDYNWAGPGFSSNMEDISNLLPGLYRITITDDSGCEIIDSVQVEAENIVVVRIANVTACSESQDDQFLIAIVDGGSGSSQYQWFDGQGIPISNDSAIQVGYPVNDTDFYRVEIINSGCSASDVGYVLRGQIPDVDAGPDETILNGESIEIGGNPTSSVAGSTFNWIPAQSLSNNEAANPFASPQETTIYTVVVTDQLGCQNSDSVLITVVNAFEVPSGITPNGDGKNDVWELDFIEKYPNARVIVINRWGQEVFSSDGYEVPWDGTLDGSPLPVGTYYYIIDLKTDLLEPMTGPITIMR